MLYCIYIILYYIILYCIKLLHILYCTILLQLYKVIFHHSICVYVYLYVIMYKLYCLISFLFVEVQRNCEPLWHLSMCCIPQKFTRYKSPFSFCSFAMTL